MAKPKKGSKKGGKDASNRRKRLDDALERMSSGQNTDKRNIKRFS